LEKSEKRRKQAFPLHHFEFQVDFEKGGFIPERTRLLKTKPSVEKFNKLVAAGSRCGSAVK
jgi:hypothetical protein